MADPLQVVESRPAGPARSARPTSIRLRLLLLVLAVLLPAVAAALLMILRTYAAEDEATRRNMRDTTRALSMVIDGELSRRATIAQVLALSSHLGDGPDLSPRELAGFAEQARAAARHIGGWIELSAGERVLFSTRGDLPPSSRREPRLVSQSLLQPLEREPEDGRLRATLVEPVVREGRTVLNVSVSLLPEELQAIIDRQNLPADWTAAILDDRGTIVARHPGGLRYAGRTATPDLLRQVAMSQEAAFQAQTLDGISTTGYFRRTERGWTYVSAMPRGPLESRVPTAVLQIVVGALLLFGLAIAGATWLSRRIVQPIYALRAAAAQMQAGERVEPQATGLSECDDVAAALADASRAAERTREDLELRVRQAVERTQEAERRVSQNRRVEALGRLILVSLSKEVAESGPAGSRSMRKKHARTVPSGRVTSTTHASRRATWRSRRVTSPPPTSAIHSTVPSGRSCWNVVIVPPCVRGHVSSVRPGSGRRVGEAAQADELHAGGERRHGVEQLRELRAGEREDDGLAGGLDRGGLRGEPAGEQGDLAEAVTLR